MNRRTAFLIGLLLELVAVFGLFVPYIIRMANGTEVTLLTEPVDPWSMFRGNYVTLAYTAGKIEAPAQYDDQPETTVYVTLEKKGDVYDRVAITDAQPTLKPGQVCLMGRRNSWSQFIMFPDIAQYFAEPDIAKQFEAEQRQHRLYVTASVNDACRGLIKWVTVGPAAEPDETVEPLRPVPEAMRPGQ